MDNLPIENKTKAQVLWLYQAGNRFEFRAISTGDLEIFWFVVLEGNGRWTIGSLLSYRLPVRSYPNLLLADTIFSDEKKDSLILLIIQNQEEVECIHIHHIMDIKHYVNQSRYHHLINWLRISVYICASRTLSKMRIIFLVSLILFSWNLTAQKNRRFSLSRYLMESH